jgi:signal transduction histidine kinase
VTAAVVLRRARTGDAAWYLFTAFYCAFVLGWLLIGLAVAVTKHPPASVCMIATMDAQSGVWGPAWASASGGLRGGACFSYPPGDVVLDYVFSGVNLLFAAILFRLARRDWTVRCLVIGMLGSAGAFNLQAHTTIYAVEAATGVDIDLWHIVLLHGVGGVAYVFAVLLFPTGTLDWGGRHNWLARVLLLTSIAGTTALLAVSTAEAPHTVSFVLFFGLLIPIAGVTAQLVRYRRATSGEARQQSRVLLWALGLSFAAALVLIVITLTTLTGHVSAMPGMGSNISWLDGLSSPVVFWIFRAVFTMIPFAIMAGVLRFRLWDVEQVLNWTLIYSVLVAMIGAVYVFGVVRIEQRLGLANHWASPVQIVAVGLIALAFQPARARVGQWADRLIYGKRKPSYDVLAEVAALRQASEPGAAALESLARVVAEGLTVGSASVVLDLPDGTSDSYRWPAGEAAGAGTADERRIPVSYRGEHVGALCLPASEDRLLTPDRRTLLSHLAGSAGMFLHNASLSIQLQHSLHDTAARSAEIRASRLRIVAAQDDERRDLERNLHDGAQPSLTAVRLTLGLASHMGQAGEIAGARQALGQLQGQITDALARLHQTLRRLDPQIVSLHELEVALREQSEVLGARPLFRVPAGPGGTGTSEDTALDPVVGAAVYLCCTEALQNTVKHCPDAPVEVHAGFGTDGRRLRFSVADAGPGFDITAVPAGGGLQNMADRIGAVGGDLTVHTELGKGTRVTGWVPVALGGVAGSEPAPGGVAGPGLAPGGVAGSEPAPGGVAGSELALGGAAGSGPAPGAPSPAGEPARE